MALTVIVFSFFISFQLQAHESEDFSIHGVLCGDKFELLDYKELYDVDTSYKFDLTGSSVNDFLDSYLDRIKDFAPFRAVLYQDWRNQIDSKIKFVTNVNFGESRDQINFVQWNNCEIKILAKAQNPRSEGKSFYIDEDLWNKLSAKAKAGVYFNYFLNVEHIFYSDNDHTEFTRYFNALVASNVFITLNKSKDYFPLYELLDFKYVAWKGFLFRVYSLADGTGRTRSIRYNQVGDITIGTIIPPNSLFFSSSQLNFDLKFENEKNLKVEFWEPKMFKPNSLNEFRINDLKIKSKMDCLGPYDISKVKYVDLTLKLVGDKLHIISVHGDMQYKGFVIEGIYLNKGKYEIKFDENTEVNQHHDILIKKCSQL
jgi:hypothetical protein